MWVKEFFGSKEQVPEDIAQKFKRAEAAGGPTSSILLSPTDIDQISKLNLDKIKENDVSYLNSFDDKNYMNPVPMEAFAETREMYPQDLLDLLNSNHPNYGRQGAAYADFGEIDFSTFNEDKPILTHIEVEKADEELKEIRTESAEKFKESFMSKVDKQLSVLSSDNSDWVKPFHKRLKKVKSKAENVSFSEGERNVLAKLFGEGNVPSSTITIEQINDLNDMYHAMVEDIQMKDTRGEYINFVMLKALQRVPKILGRLKSKFKSLENQFNQQQDQYNKKIS